MTRKATLTDIDAIKEIADKNRDSIGFLIRPAIEASISKSECLVNITDDKIVGFVRYHIRKDGICKIYEIVISKEYRRRGLGKSMIRSIKLSNRRLLPIELKCPVDLDANIFYSSIDFKLISIDRGKKRLLNTWQLI